MADDSITKHRTGPDRRARCEAAGKPLLSIGIIFKNEIRCIERCLRSLQPLREAVPCQIVMADTGSADGSREIAAEYADILFDFPWIDDFSAARNAVLDRCAGTWVLVVDCDEWLDPDISELAEYVRDKRSAEANLAFLIQRNYSDPGLTRWADFAAGRLLCISAHPRYEGKIHEHPAFRRAGGHIRTLYHTILHHDGYVGLYGTPAGAEKRKRNLRLIREELAANPDNLQWLKYFLDSGEEEADFLAEASHALALIERRAPYWDSTGKPVIRTAVEYAASHGLPIWKEWADKAEQLFSDSYFVRLDICYIRLTMAAQEQRSLAEVISLCEAYLRAKTELREDGAGREERTLGIFHWGNETVEKVVRETLAEARAQLEERKQEAQQRREAEEQQELRALAEQVRAILAAYPPDDPAVAQLKSTPVYQSVKHLIE